MDVAEAARRVKSPGQNGFRERRLEPLTYERLYLRAIADGLDLVEHAMDYRVDYDIIRIHEALSWNSPLDAHFGRHDTSTPNFPETKILPNS